MLAEPVLQVAHFRLEFLLGRPPFELELARAAPAAVMRETEKVERAGGSLAATLVMLTHDRGVLGRFDRVVDVRELCGKGVVA